MRKLKTIALGLLASITITASAQQIPLIDHYYVNPYLSNPAAAGDNGNNIFGIYRTQWVDVEGAPETFLITLDGGVKNERIGLGFTLHNDIVNIVGKTGVMGTYSYKLPVNETDKLSFGVSLGVEQDRLLFDRINSENPTEVTLITNVKNETKFDANFGIKYGTERLNVGIAGYQLFANTNKFENTTNYEKYKFSFLRHYLATASYDFTVNENIMVTPFLQGRIAPEIKPQIDLVGIVKYKDQIWAGLGYRNQFGVNFTAGTTIGEKFQVGYSYGMSTGDIARLSTSTHEILFGLKLGKSNSNKDSDKDGVKDDFDFEPFTPHWEHTHSDVVNLDASACIVDSRGIAKDSDFDRVPDCVDKEIFSIVGAPVDEDGVALDSDKDGVPDMFDREDNTPEGCTADRFGVALDDDKDGVPNCFDDEPKSPFGAKVDEKGVALDSDLDRVPDFYDFEPETPHWEHLHLGTPNGDASKCIVDKKGVTMDSDHDGVPDCVDAEINSPRNAIVDKNGVALDSDKDGVPDGLDLEPNSPANCEVDQWGRCGLKADSPLDSDGDLVPDSRDLEPNTPPNTPVDAVGRAIINGNKKDPYLNRIELEDMVDNDSEWTYYVIVGVFRDKGNVLRYQKHLTQHYYENTSILLTAENYNYVWTKIVVTKQEAATEIARLQAKNIQEYIVGNPWLWRVHK